MNGISILREDEAAELDAFLATHAYSSMYLRGALHKGADRASFSIKREAGAIVAAAQHAASGMLVLQAPVDAGAVARAALRSSGRRLAGFFGPVEQMQAARHEMGLDDVPFQKNTPEDLFALTLAQLRVPAALVEKALTCRVAVEADEALMLAWRAGFRRHIFNEMPGEAHDKATRADVAALLPAGALFILESDVPLACCSFNARLPDMVQVGNVWTPPENRGRGYAQAVVAGALEIARNAGVTRAVLSTGRQNLPAQAAYRAIGFEVVGDYGTAAIAADVVLPVF
jgi:ribosomal protein S18 acetylase RimI-like enzyme